MRNLKRLCVITAALSAMAFALTACGSKEETKTEKETTTVAEVAVGEETTTAGEAAESEAETISKEDAAELVKGEFGEDAEFTYVPADELEEKDGSQYYVILVKMVNEAGTATTVTQYMVKTDGSEWFDKYAADYAGEYTKTGETGDTTFVVNEDGTFEMTTTGTVNQVLSGKYKTEVTNSAEVVKLTIYPHKNVVDGAEQEVEEGATGTVVIEAGTLTLTLESEATVFTKK